MRFLVSLGIISNCKMFINIKQDRSRDTLHEYTVTKLLKHLAMRGHLCTIYGFNPK